MTNYASSVQLVVAGLDPAIHLGRVMDARIKSGHDEVWLVRRQIHNMMDIIINRCRRTHPMDD
jgi:hypothetical protein